MGQASTGQESKVQLDLAFWVRCTNVVKSSIKQPFIKGNSEVKKNHKTLLEEYIFNSDLSYLLIFFATSLQSTQGPIWPGQWKIGLSNSKGCSKMLKKLNCVNHKSVR